MVSHGQSFKKKYSQAKSGSDLERKEMLPTVEEMHNLSQEIPQDQFYNTMFFDNNKDDDETIYKINQFMIKTTTTTKIPSEMEVAPHYKLLLHCFTV